jgi:hypothetical protein
VYESVLPSALEHHEVCIVLLHDASENASVKREAVENQDSGTNRASIGRWLTRLAVICLPPQVPLPWLAFRKIAVCDTGERPETPRLGSSKQAGRIYK